MLMDQNAANIPPLADKPTVSKDQAIKQLTESTNGDGSIFQQLAGNPFFTAVRLARSNDAFTM